MNAIIRRRDVATLIEVLTWILDVVPLVRGQMSVVVQFCEGEDEMRTQKGVDIKWEESGWLFPVLGPVRVVTDSFVFRFWKKKKSKMILTKRKKHMVTI